MSARADLTRLLTHHRWHKLHERDRGETWFRWNRDDNGQYREEITLIFDNADRLEVWSRWKNYRASITHQPGTRKALEEFVQRSGVNESSQ